MAVGDSINYFKILTNAPTGLSRVLLSAPDSNTVLGNVEDPIQEKDAVNLGYLKKVISEIPGSTPYTGTDGIVIDPTTHVITADLQYIQDNLTFPQTLSNGIGIAPIIGDNLINVDLSGYFVPNPILMVVQETNFISAIGAGNGTVQLFAQTTSTPNSSSLNLTTENANLEYINGSGISTQVFLDDTGMLLRAANLKISYLAGGGSGTLIADNAGNISKGALSGFMHLTGAIDESADGNKTFTGVTQADYFVSNRIYSSGGFSPNIKFYNSIADGGAAFSIVGPIGSNNTNYLEVNGTLTGANPILSAQGINANIGMDLTPKGTGTVNITTLAGTGSRVAIITSTGQVGAIANTTDAYVLTLVSGVPTWAAASGGGGGGTDVTIGTFGTSPDAKAATINGGGQILTIQPADAAHPGAISLVAQTLGAGDKTFTDNIIVSSNKDYKNAAGTHYLKLDGGGFGRLKSAGNLFIDSINQSIALGNGSISFLGGNLNFNSSDTINFVGSVANKTIVFQKNTGGGGQVHFFDPVYMKNPGGTTLATATANQLGSSVLNFESNLYNGTTGILKNFSIAAIASTTVNNLTNLVTTYDGTNLLNLSQTGDFEILNTGAGIILKDTIAGTRHRITLTGGVLTVSAAL